MATDALPPRHTNPATLLCRSREASPSVSMDSAGSLPSTSSDPTFIRAGASRESVSPEPLSAEARAQDMYYKNELVNVKRSFRERMLAMKVRMKEEEAALKRKIVKLESEAVGLLASNARLLEVEEENRHLKETVTNLVTVLTEANKPEPKRLKLS